VVPELVHNLDSFLASYQRGDIDAILSERSEEYIDYSDNESEGGDSDTDSDFLGGSSDDSESSESSESSEAGGMREIGAQFYLDVKTKMHADIAYTTENCPPFPTYQDFLKACFAYFQREPEWNCMQFSGILGLSGEEGDKCCADNNFVFLMNTSSVKVKLPLNKN